MTFRNVKYLADNIELQKLLNKYSLRLNVINDEKIFLLSRCFIFEIYGLVVEDFFYFDLYSIDLNSYSNIDRLLSEFDSQKIHTIYQSQTTSRKQVIIPKLQGNEENTLKAEQYFFTILQLMDELMSDILFCEKEIKQEYWSEIFDYKRIELESVLH